MLIIGEIKRTRCELDNVSKNVFELHMLLSRVLCLDFWINVEASTTIKEDQAYTKATNKQIAKYECLLKKQHIIANERKNFVVNLVDINLDEAMLGFIGERT